MNAGETNAQRSGATPCCTQPPNYGSERRTRTEPDRLALSCGKIFAAGNNWHDAQAAVNLGV